MRHQLELAPSIRNGLSPQGRKRRRPETLAKGQGFGSIVKDHSPLELISGHAGQPFETSQLPGEDDLRAALSPTSTLIATGLVEITARSVDLEDKLDVWKDLPNLLFAPHADAETLMAHFLKRSPRRTLALAHFPHLERDTAAAVGLSRAALRHKISGVNLLLYGPPGVGKTECAAALAEAVGADLYEVDYADEDGDPIRPNRRAVQAMYG